MTFRALRGQCALPPKAPHHNQTAQEFQVGWVEERGVVQGCTDYEAEDANPAIEVRNPLIAGFRKLNPAYQVSKFENDDEYLHSL